MPEVCGGNGAYFRFVSGAANRIPESGSILSRMLADFDDFGAAILNLIALRRERLDALSLPDPALQAELEDLETEYLALVDTATGADKAEIGEFYCEALRVFGSNEEIFAQYPDVAGLLLTLRIEGARRRAMEMLRRQIAYTARSSP